MPVKNHLVSVIIPAYNREKYVAQAIDSVFAGDYRPIEVIVVDDGSTDSTARIVRKYDHVQYIHQSNQGVASARNTGITASRGEIIAFLDSDDFWPSHRLTVAVRYFEQHPEVGYVLGKQLMFVEPGCAVPPWMNAEWLAEPQEASNTAVLVVRRKILDRVGLFNPDYIAGEDTEWLVRASEARVSLARLPEIVLHRRFHKGNVSVQMIGKRKEILLKIARESIHRQQNK